MKGNTQKTNFNDSASITKLYSGNTLDINGLPSWLPKASFSKNTNRPSITSPNGSEILLVDYFTNFELPSFKTENGLVTKGDFN